MPFLCYSRCYFQGFRRLGVPVEIDTWPELRITPCNRQVIIVGSNLVGLYIWERLMPLLVSSPHQLPIDTSEIPVHRGMPLGVAVTCLVHSLPAIVLYNMEYVPSPDISREDLERIKDRSWAIPGFFEAHRLYTVWDYSW